MTTLTVLTGPLDHMSSHANTTTYLLTSAAPTGIPSPQQSNSNSSFEDSQNKAPKRQRTGSAGDAAAAARRRSGRAATAPPAVARRNERERNRVRQVNLGFATLRQHVPAKSKKMSKVETLRSAVQYIKQLQQLLREEAGEEGGEQLSPSPSLGSDASSPYDSLSPEDEELLDFTTWLS